MFRISDLLTTFLFKINPLYDNNFVYNETQQKILISNWLYLYKQGLVLQDSYQYGFRTFSQTNEDGILLYIFTIIGTTNKKVVEIGINCNNSSSNIPESISTNLISFHGWYGLLIDSDEKNVGQILHHFHINRSVGYYFFNSQKKQVNEGSSILSPIIRNYFVTPENINDLLIKDGFAGEIDLLSIDIDSFDYQVFDAINACSPRVLMLEADGGKIDYDTEFAIKYPEDKSPVFYEVIKKYMNTGFSGTMSLLAAVNLAKSKGYRLVTLSSGGWNAFFMRNDVGLNDFPEISVEEAYKRIPAIYSLKERGQLWNIKDLEKQFPNLFTKS